MEVLFLEATRGQEEENCGDAGCARPPAEPSLLEAAATVVSRESRIWQRGENPWAPAGTVLLGAEPGQSRVRGTPQIPDRKIKQNPLDLPPAKLRAVSPAGPTPAPSGSELRPDLQDFFSFFFLLKKMRRNVNNYNPRLLFFLFFFYSPLSPPFSFFPLLLSCLFFPFTIFNGALFFPFSNSFHRTCCQES